MQNATRCHLHRPGFFGLMLLFLVGCSEPSSTKDKKSSGAKTASDPAPTATASAKPDSPGTGGPLVIGPPGDGSATITFNPNGPNKMDFSKLKGKPEDCAAAKKCCDGASGALALGCMLSLQADGGDCAKMLAMAREQGCK